MKRAHLLHVVALLLAQFATAAPCALASDDLAPPNEPDGCFAAWKVGDPPSVPDQDAVCTCSDWRAIGPVPALGGHDGAVDQPAPPEPAVGRDASYPGLGHAVSWRPVPWFDLGRINDLSTALGPSPAGALKDDAVAYVAATLHAPTSGKVWVVIGFSDGGELWLNGNQAIRSRQDGSTLVSRRKALLPVHAGDNPVLIKIVHPRTQRQVAGGPQEHLGAWAFDLRLPDGACHKYGHALEQALQDGKLGPEAAKRAHARLAHWYDDLGQRAWALYHARLAARGDPTAEDRALLGRLCQLLLADDLGDSAAHEAVVIDLLHHDRDGLPDAVRWRMQTALIERLLLDGKKELAMREAERLAEAEGDVENRRSLWLLAGRAREQADDIDRAVASYRAAILANPQGDACTVEALAAIHRLRALQADPAVGLAHAMLLAAVGESRSQFAAGLDAVVHGLLRVDGNALRVSQLYRLQWYGPAGPDGVWGTADDIADPLAGVQVPQDPDWCQALARRLEDLPPSIDGDQLRMRLELMLGDTAAALRVGRARLDRTADARELDQAVRDLAVVVRVASGSAALADAFSRIHESIIAGEAPAPADLALARSCGLPIRDPARPISDRFPQDPRWSLLRAAVRVTEGLLTVANAPAGVANKLCFLEIHGPTRTRTVCFRPAAEADASPMPAGALIDHGEAFGERPGGMRYGWEIADGLVRLRRSAAAPDGRYLGVACFQRPVDAPSCSWSMAVPNGDYVVWLCAGDGEETANGYAFSVCGVQATGPHEDRFAPVAREQWGRYLADRGAALEHDAPAQALLAYVELLTCFCAEPPSAGALEGMLRTFLNQHPETVDGRAAAFAAYRAFVRAALPAGHAAEEADLLVARRQYQDGALPAAAATLDAFFTDHPRSAWRPDAEILAGVIQAEQGQAQAAVARFQRVAHQAGLPVALRSRALYLTGWAMMFERRYAEARSALEDLIASYPASDQVDKAKDLLAKLPPADAPGAGGEAKAAK